MDSETIYDSVNTRYSASALSSTSTSYGKAVAEAFGYSPEELASIPQEANLGLSCGNPLALAKLKEGETVIDLGSGAGFDVFLAARKVGETGKAIGIDMNEDMLKKARENATKTNITNTSFIAAKITSIPLPDNSADVVISNCVINLVPSPSKPQVFREIFRLLKPGGRLAVSDILAKVEFTEEMRRDVALYVGCMAGASKMEEYEGWLKDAGFVDVVIVDAKADLMVYMQVEGGEEVGSLCRGAEKKDGGCCGKEEAPCCREDEKASCCADGEVKNTGPCCSSATKVEKGSSCCGGGGEKNGGVVQDLKSLTEKYAHLNLNDWAGSYKIFALKPQ
ncbi:NAD(P)-binding protein [Lindgomyces ingoldianus]|uniref:NAD(P)-binding protein n=1 Tax=Lindgomyces ingoldianus TaxID=673940 RepID=A0ACB6QQJ3_9PLEO|nr:NAD(P)-binding protein [Lindgomyces ingoldianus]KAF2469186.1 NAD(P)-binding protein [Lindgomyces ingoldianus]